MDKKNYEKYQNIVVSNQIFDEFELSDGQSPDPKYHTYAEYAESLKAEK